MHKTLVLAACTLLLALSACGGGASSPAGPSTVRLTPSPAGAPALPASLPALPPDELLHPIRLTAAVAASQNGDAYSRKSASAVAVAGGLQLPSGANAVAWGLYLFGGVPGEALESFTFNTSGFDTGEKIYAALGDYSTGRWSFLPPVTIGSGNFNLPPGSPSPLQSPSGNTWVLFATFGGDDVTITDVHLIYPDRHNVTGAVFDSLGAGLAGIKVTTSVAGLSATTAFDGTYTLEGLPDGTWPLICTRDGFAFYSQPSFVTLAGGDAVAPNIVGNPHGSRFADYDLLPGNDNRRTAPLFDLEAGPLSESLSGDDDIEDAYRFNVTANGSYLLQFSNPDGDISMPFLSVYDDQDNLLSSSAQVLSGEVAVALTVNDAPRTFTVDAYTLGRGGKYSMTLTGGGWGRVGISLKDAALYAGGGIVNVTRAASGVTTRYLVSRPAPAVPGARVVYDPAYPLGDIDVVPEMAGYSFVPPTSSHTVTATALSTSTFAGTPPASADSFEPNNSSGTAHALTLPYDSATGPDPLQLDGKAGGDNQDFFSCMPPAGAALGITVQDSQIAPGAARYSVTVYSDTFQQLATMAVAPGAVAALPTALCNGNIVYVLVTPDLQLNQVLSYRLKVSELANPVKLQAAARVGGAELLGQARFVLYDAQFTRRLPLTAGSDGLTPGVYLPSGSTVQFDCYRYGTSHERQTMIYSLPPSDSIVYFDAPDQGQDALEPNGSVMLPLVAQAVPATLSATLNIDSDQVDTYKLGATDGKPFKLTLHSGNAMRFMVTLYDSATGLVGSRELADGETFYLPNDSVAGNYVEVQLVGTTASSYTLEVATADAYKLSGLVQNTIAVGLDGIVEVLETHDRTSSNGFGGGDYTMPYLYPPGDYTVAAFVTNFDPDPNTQAVTITNADATASFLNYSFMNHDAFEPNDDSLTATPASLATDYAASIGGADFGDYYKVTLASGDRVRFRVMPAQPWQQPSIGLLDAYTDYNLYGTLQSDGSVVLDYTVVEAGDYVVFINGQAHYTFRVDKLN